jgi:predicted RNA-binding Zn-ribbon protein involved in translation (DUF1610 family)
MSSSAPPPSMSGLTAAPPPPSKVLKCLDCDFACLSNNQMCRHVFQTCHTLVTCSQCNVRLVSWGFSPGVKKLFDKARKDGVLLEDFTIETAEKHFDATQHQNNNVPAKENFVVQGPPEAFGLQPAAARQDPLQDTSSTRFRCPDCANVISTWTQMTRHLDATKHSLARCADCGLTLKCYGPAQPQRHEKMTGHRGVIGVFRQKGDYAIHPVSGGQGGRYTSCSKWQTPQFRCFCGVSFLHPLYLASHLVSIHATAPFPHATCLECGTEGSIDDMVAHMHSNDGHNEFDTPDLHADDYLIAATGGCIVHDPSAVSDVLPPATGKEVSPYRILYQCPDCLIVVTSWCRLEEHLMATKHGLCFCVTCDRYLQPRGGSESHTAITGHANVVREHLSRRDYEVLVNIEDASLASSIEPTDMNVAAQASAQTVYQCPMPNCLAVFPTIARLEDHFLCTRHGTVSCPECFADVTVLDIGGVAGHEHPLEAPEYLQHVTCTDDMLVTATTEQLVVNFSEEFELCTSCHRAIPRTDMARHIKSAQCVAAAAPLDASTWAGEPTSQPVSAPGSFHGTSQPASIGNRSNVSPQPPVTDAAKLPHLVPPPGGAAPIPQWHWASTPGAAIGPVAGAPHALAASQEGQFVWAPSMQ